MAEQTIARIGLAIKFLLRTQPTQKGLDAYLASPMCVTPANVFATAVNASHTHRRHALCRDLPNYEGDALKGVLIYHYPEGTKIRRGYRRVGTVREDQREEIQAFNNKIEGVCSGLTHAWEAAFEHYSPQWKQRIQELERDALPEYPIDLSGWGRGGLYLDPHPTLPHPDLISSLCRESDLPQLIVLTARHELGYLYRKIERWRALGDRVGTALPLSTWDWSLLAARAGYVSGWDPSVVRDPTLGYVAVPIPSMTPQTTLGALYAHLGEFAATLQRDRLQVRTCQTITDGMRCGAPVPAYEGAGPPYKHCAKHSRSRKNRTPPM